MGKSITNSLSCPLQTKLELEPCIRSWPSVVPPYPSECPSLCSALSSSTSHLYRLCAFRIECPSCSEPRPAEPGTAGSQHTLAGGCLGFCSQLRSLMELAHYVLGTELSMVKGKGSGELTETAMQVPRACFFSLSLASLSSPFTWWPWLG